VGDLLAPQFDQTEAGALVEHDDQQEPANHRDVNALFLSLVGERREFFFSDELRHSSRSGNVAGCERRQTGCVKISHFTLGCDLLTVLIYQKHHLG
jgi:hypothetical protein